MSADYVRGKMDISAQKGTFDGVMMVSVWSSLLLLMSIFYFTLVFAVGVDWMGALIGVSALSAVLGMLLSMGSAWYFTVAGLFVFGLAIGGISALVGALLGS
jgi:hypothetical protein